MKRIRCVWAGVLLVCLSLVGRAETITSPEQLAEWYDVQVADLPPAPVLGGEVMELNASPRYLCTALRQFPKAFVRALIAHEEYDLYLYDLWIIPDVSTGELVFYNESFEEVGAVYWYDQESAWSFGVYAVGCTLVDAPDWDDLQKTLEEEAEAAEEELLLQPMMMRSLGDGITPDPEYYIRAGIGRVESNITVSMIVSNGFTNAVEIYSTDDLLTGDWSIRATNLQFSGGYTNTWTDPAAANTEKRFYIIGNGGLDLDGDGLIDSREAFIYLTDRTKYDTDGDGIGDGEELMFDGTDPLDFYSVRPPDLLRASGASLVDESDSPVVLRSVNIGNWLAWERWMLGFEPAIVTNLVGQVRSDDTSEADMLDMMMGNVDGQVTLLATDYDVKSAGTEQDNWTSWVCDYGVEYMKFAKGDYLGFTNRYFGEQGVSNLAVGLALTEDRAGQYIDVYLGATNGALLGTLTTRSCGPFRSDYAYWSSFTEQSITLNQTLTGTQTVYFVGRGYNDIANLFSFRFYREPTNTADLVETFRDFYFVTNDLDRIKSLGYNCIRLPFFYRLLEDDIRPYTYKQSGWDRLDWVIDECAKRRLWVLLDLHGAAGGINNWHSCGEKKPFRNRLWHNETYIDRTEELWRAIAGHYRTNTTVLGYDLLNEPSPPMQEDTLLYKSQVFSNDILPVMDRLYDAVRSTDTVHMIFMEGNQMHNGMWEDGSTAWWPVPASNGWTNVCYEFHSYEYTVWSGGDDPFDAGLTTQKASCDALLRDVSTLREVWNAPVFIGEFGPCGEQNFEYWTRRMNAQNVSWCHWNYRSWGWDDSDKPEQGKTTWGLDYRTQATTNDAPNLQTDDLPELYRKMGMYGHTNYTDNACMQTVMSRHAENPDLSKEDTCDFFLHTFSADVSYSLTDDWPWNKVSAVGASNQFWVIGNQARLYIGSDPALMRCRSRVEADARFLINDAPGCIASVKIEGIAVSSTGSGNEASVSLAFVRDEINQPLADYPTEGVIARLAYDHNTGLAELQLFAKTNAAVGTLGTNLYAASNLQVTFVAGQALELHENSTSAFIRYNGTNYPTVTHGISLDQWPDNAVCLVQAEKLVAGSAVYVDLDDLCAQRANPISDTLFVEDFSEYPNGIELGGVPDAASYPPDVWSTNLNAHSYVAESGLRWVPESWNYGNTWYNPRRTYQQDTRFLLTATNVLEMQMSCSGFSNGVIKMAFMPEYFPKDVYGGYNGPTIYAEVKYEEGSTSELVFDLVRQWGVDSNRQWVAASHHNAYDTDKIITFQIGPSTARIYYGSTCLINAGHGTNALSVYPNGAYPHYEFHNEADTDNAVSILNDVRVRNLSGFEAP